MLMRDQRKKVPTVNAWQSFYCRGNDLVQLCEMTQGSMSPWSGRGAVFF